MRDLLERSLWTGVETGLAIFTVESLTDLSASVSEKLFVMGVATLYTALKVLATGRLSQLPPI